MAFFNYFFSFHGQINRTQWWLARLYWLIAIFVIDLAIAFATVYATGGQSADIPLFVVHLQILVYWIMALSLNVRRFRERGKPGLWGLIMFVPVIGPIWTLIECGFLAPAPGTVSEAELAARFD